MLFIHLVSAHLPYCRVVHRSCNLILQTQFPPLNQ